MLMDNLVTCELFEYNLAKKSDTTKSYVKCRFEKFPKKVIIACRQLSPVNCDPNFKHS